MANIFPRKISPDTNSNAERKLYDQLHKQLSDDYTVIHSVRWITRNPRQHESVGEADFVIAHPSKGVIVLEVKGGSIHIDRGKWYTVNRHGQKNALGKDPIAQAEKSVYALLDHLEHSKPTDRYNIKVYHAVAFPDIEVDQKRSLRPDIPNVIVIDQSKLSDLSQVIDDIFTFWRARLPHSSPGRNAIRALIDLLVPKIEIKTKIAYQLEEENQQIKELTKRQYNILRAMQSSRRLAIIGGAGTGKTMLAVEKALQLAESEFKVLLLCYNRNLADHLESITSDSDKITVYNFHRLTYEAMRWAGISMPDNKSDFYDKPEEFLYEALEVVHSSAQTVERYLFDAVIIDEGQDFLGDYWIPVPDLLKDRATGVLYIFFDDNQRIYAQLSNIPISREQSHLTLINNCRNTQSIFNVLKDYASTTTETRSVGPEGRPVEYLEAENEKEAHKTLRSLLHRLIVEGGAKTSHIVILTPRAESKSIWLEGAKLGNYTLTWNLEDTRHDHVCVSTIHSYKGLESPIVVLTEIEHAREETREQLIYIGISRARNDLFIIGDLPTPEGEKF